MTRKRVEAVKMETTEAWGLSYPCLGPWAWPDKWRCPDSVKAFIGVGGKLVRVRIIRETDYRRLLKEAEKGRTK